MKQQTPKNRVGHNVRPCFGDRRRNDHSIIIADAANAIPAAIIFRFPAPDLPTRSMIVEKTITPPVTIGYWTDAGKCNREISNKRFAMLFSAELPDAYANAFWLNRKLRSFCARSNTTLKTTVRSFVSIRKSALSTHHSRWD